MNPLHLRATNLRSYPSLDWTIPEGTSAIIGPNGAGKSTLLGAIELALFADGSRDLAPALGPYGDRLEITLDFEHNGETYRVRRGYTGGTRGKATLDFERTFSTNGYRHQEPLTRESASATQALIEETLGLTRPTFNASAFLAQGNAGAFPEASPADRKAILGAILDPRSLWTRLATRAAGERKAVEAELLGAQARMADRAELAEQIPQLEAAHNRATGAHNQAGIALERADRLLEQAQAALAANEAAAERLRAARQAQLEAENRCDNARDAYQAAQEQADRLPAAQERLAELAAIAATVPELEAKAEAQSKALAQADAIRRRKQDADASIERSRDNHARLTLRYDTMRRDFDTAVAQYEHLEVSQSDEHCDRCQQLLGEEARLAAIASLKTQALDLNDRLLAELQAAASVETELDRLRTYATEITIPEVDAADYSTPLAQARRAAEERAGLAVAIEGYEREVAKLPGLDQALREAEQLAAERAAVSARTQAEQQDGPALERAANDARQAQRNARAALDAAQADLVRAQESLSRAEQAAEELKALREQTAEANQRLDTLRLAERACGRDGIPALIAENTVPVLEAEANRILERLPTAGGTTFRVELRTQRALKSDASALRETLDILVYDRSSAREYLTYSGGERFRVSFALRWALARLLANRRGAESRLLVIDEPDGLDAEGMDGLAAVLREESGGFERILLVSHNPLLATAFEQVVEVASDGEVSRLVASTTEEVFA